MCCLTLWGSDLLLSGCLAGDAGDWRILTSYRSFFCYHLPVTQKLKTSEDLYLPQAAGRLMGKS